MATTQVLRPNVVIAQSGWSVTGAASIHAALADGTFTPDAPNTSTRASNPSTFGILLLGLTDPTFPADDIRITNVRIRIHGYRGANFNSHRASTFLGTKLDPKVDDWQLASGIGNARWAEGRARPRNPMGGLWSKSDIEFLGVQLWANFAVDVTVTELLVEVTHVLPPVVLVATPIGDQLTSRPTLSHAYGQEDGRAQALGRWKVFDQATFADPGFDPEASIPVYDSGELEGDASQHHVPTADLLSGSYRAYVKAASTVQGLPHWSEWAWAGFTVLLDEPSAPFVDVTEQPDLGRAEILIVGTDNLLTEQDADFEDSSKGTGLWVGAFSNALLSRELVNPAHGNACMVMEADAAGDMGAVTAYRLAVEEGEFVQMMASFRAIATPRSCTVGLTWYDAAGVQIGTPVYSDPVTDSTSGYTVATFGATAPSGAVTVVPSLHVAGCADGEKHRVDAIKVAPGFSVWSRGGLAPRNLLRENTASIETDASGWAVRANCAIARSTTVAADGTASLRLTATAAGNIGAVTVDRVPCVPGRSYTALASFRAATAGRTVRASLHFYDAAGNLIDYYVGAAATDTTSGFTQATITRDAPPGAAFVDVAGFVYGASSGEQHYIDKASVSPSSLPDWMPGGGLVTSRVLVEITDDPLDVADADATWRTARGLAAVELDGVQSAIVHDYWIPPNRPRRYRVRKVADEDGVPLAGAWSIVHTAHVPTDVWWWKDPDDPDRNIGDLPVKGPLQEKIEEQAEATIELSDGTEDRVLPVVVSDSVAGDDGELRLVIQTDEEWEALRAAITRRRPGLLVSPYRWQRWIYPLGTRTIELTGTPTTPRRIIGLSYVEVEEPA